jgi:NAD/NADP transhydrogenase beta subunit
MNAMQVHQVQAPWLSYVVPLVVIGAIILFRLRRMSRQTPLKLERLWILPVIYAAIVASVFIGSPPSPMGWSWCAVGLVLGAGIGWYRGRMMRITVDPETHALSQQASPAAFLMLIALIVLRTVARQEIGGGYGPANHSTMLATDILMSSALGLIAATRIEMALRARRLLDEARAGRPR